MGTNEKVVGVTLGGGGGYFLLSSSGLVFLLLPRRPKVQFHLF